MHSLASNIQYHEIKLLELANHSVFTYYMRKAITSHSNIIGAVNLYNINLHKIYTTTDRFPLKYKWFLKEQVPSNDHALQYLSYY